MMNDDDDEGLVRRAAKLALLESGPEAEEEHAADLIAADEGDAMGQARLVEAQMPNADSLLQKSTMRGDRWSMLNRIAKFSRLQPPSVLNGIFGNQASITPNVAQQVVAPLANWGGETEETMPVTVTFAPVLFNDTFRSVLASRRPFGIVQFGSKGALVRLEVDVGRGCQFTISASAVTLQVGFDISPTNVGATGLESVPFLGTLSFLPIVRTVPITRTVFVDNPIITNGNNRVFNVPLFAGNVVLWAATGFDPAVQIDFLDSAGNVAYTFAKAAGVPMLTPIPLSTDIVQIRLTNGGPSSLLGRLIFQLEL